jgi:hypothetical protein
MVLLVILIVVGGLGAAGRGPAGTFFRAVGLSSSDTKSATGPQPRPLTPTSGEQSTTSTTLPLDYRKYSPGNCVTWDVSATGQTPTSVVPCSSPHLIEMVEGIQLKAYGRWATYPSLNGWQFLINTECAQPVNAYLGYALNANGRFYLGAIFPLERAWADGQRTLWCGIEERTGADPSPVIGAPSAFTGTVRGQDQTFLYAVGTCLPVGSTAGTFGQPTSCATPHLVEITGDVDIAGQTQSLPQNPDEWIAAIGQGCRNLAASYYGAPLPNGIEWGYLGIPQSSWDAGGRTVMCTIGQYDANNNPVAETGSLRG